MKCLAHSKALIITIEIIIVIKYFKFYYKQAKCPGSKVEGVPTVGIGIKLAD